MKTRWLIGVVAALALYGAGCEIESQQDGFTISPSEVYIAGGESILFTVHGSQNTRWTLSNPTWGTLSSANSDQVVYTSRFTPDRSEATQVLSAESLGDDGTVIEAGQALITHLPSGATAASTTTTTTRPPATTTTTASGSTTTPTPPGPLPPPLPTAPKGTAAR